MKCMENQIRIHKNTVRRRMRQLLQSMPLTEKLRQSEQIIRAVTEHHRFASAERISIYLNTSHEVVTERLLIESWKLGKKCFIPKYDPASFEMQMVPLLSIQEYESLPLTSWNIRQPSLDLDQEDALYSGGLDLIVVPGLAFTESGHRLGSGKGYYDRYVAKLLSRCSPDRRPFLMGLAFAQQVLQELPVDEHDVILDQVITANCH